MEHNHTIRISAKVFCFDAEDRLLLVKGHHQEKYGEYWATPGGGVEENESLTAAGAREVLEETGYTAKILKPVFMQDYTIKKSGGRNFEVFFIADLDGTVPKKAEHDHEIAWFSEADFLKLQFLPEHINPFEVRKSDGIEYSTYLE